MLLLFGCVSREAASPVVPEPVKDVQPEVREGWQAEWKKTLEAARKEGRVSVYATGTAGVVLKEALSVFREKFGLVLEITTGRGGELSTKLLREKAAGLHTVDVNITGSNSMFGVIKPAGVIVPLEPSLILPDVQDPKAWFGGKFPWGDDEHLIAFYQYSPNPMIAINTDLVKPGEIKSYFDLLDPRWKGKVIINDPTTEGTSFNGFSSLIMNKVVDLDFFRQLVAMQSALLRDQRLQLDWLARGKYSVLLWPWTGGVTEYLRAGAPIIYKPVKEGTYVSVLGSGTALMEKAPHPNAARIFINWLFSREGQMLYQDTGLRQSARVDIPTTVLEREDPFSLRREGEIYFPAANGKEKWVLHEQDSYEKMAREVFAPLLR